MLSRAQSHNHRLIGLMAGLLAAVMAMAAVAESAEEDVDPFREAANAPAESITAKPSVNNSASFPADPDREPTIAERTIADILNEVDPDLEQIEAQIEAGEYAIPKAWLSQKIDEIEQDSHRFDPGLVRPITMLGDIQVLEGDYVGALDSFGRAIHLERVNEGLVSAGQIEIVYREAEVYRTLGDFQTANEREEYAYHVLQRAHDPYSEDMLPGLFHLAQWYEKTHNVFAARHLYQRATDVMVANGNGLSMMAVPAWRGVARTYRLERFPPIYMDGSDPSTHSSSSMQPSYGAVTINNFPAGERALQTIIQILRNYDSPTPEVAQSILDLADWHLLFEKTREAYPLYQIAYEMMAGVEGFPIEDFFGRPKLIHYPAPNDPSPPDGIPQSPVEGLVKVQFNISQRGAVRRLETMDSQPPGMMDFRVRKSLRASRFRPALVDGLPVATPDYIYTHRFAYYPQLTMTESTEESSR